MTDKTKGMYHKFVVKRTDGSSEPGGKHEGCAYFVLDLDHDKFAIPALRAYADACRDEFPELARHLDEIVNAHPCGCRSFGECMHWMTPQTPSEMANDIMRRQGKESEK